MHSNGPASEEEVIEKIKRKIEAKRKELLRIVLEREGSIVAEEVKDVYWKMCKGFILFIRRKILKLLIIIRSIIRLML